MQIKLSKKHIWICLLLCSLFFTSYISVFNTNGIISPGMNALQRSSFSGGNEHSSMNDSRHLNYAAVTGNSFEFFISSLKSSRPLDTKIGFNILSAIIAAQIIFLIYLSRLSNRTSASFGSLSITVFLHKKDGLK